MTPFLVDTNAWIAFFEDSPQLSDRAARLMESKDSICYISIVSLWEAAIKIGIGKLSLPYDLKMDFSRIVEENGFVMLPVSVADAAGVAELPKIHGDPFDRIQVLQCLLRGWTIFSRDPVFDRYGVPRIW